MASAHTPGTHGSKREKEMSTEAEADKKANMRDIINTFKTKPSQKKKLRNQMQTMCVSLGIKIELRYARVCVWQIWQI